MEEEENELTLGEKISDEIARFGGSWAFIISFFTFLILWIILNLLLLTQAFDPFPFILLNLCLSCLASIQAPVILMAQNRREARDRQRDEKEYLINQRAEVEVRQLHHKIDDLFFKVDRINENIGSMQEELFALLNGQVVKKVNEFKGEKHGHR